MSVVAFLVCATPNRMLFPTRQKTLLNNRHRISNGSLNLHVMAAPHWGLHLGPDWPASGGRGGTQYLPGPAAPLPKLQRGHRVTRIVSSGDDDNSKENYKTNPRASGGYSVRRNKYQEGRAAYQNNKLDMLDHRHNV